MVGTLSHIITPCGQQIKQPGLRFNLILSNVHPRSSKPLVVTLKEDLILRAALGFRRFIGGVAQSLVLLRFVLLHAGSLANLSGRDRQAVFLGLSERQEHSVAEAPHDGITDLSRWIRHKLKVSDWARASRDIFSRHADSVFDTRQFWATLSPLRALSFNWSDGCRECYAWFLATNFHSIKNGLTPSRHWWAPANAWSLAFFGFSILGANTSNSRPLLGKNWTFAGKTGLF